MRRARPGFTLIELMIVVAIIGILAAVAVPKFANLLRKSEEAACKGNLGALRSAISIYYSDMAGQYPDDLASLTVGGKYMAAIPPAKAAGYHADSSAILLVTAATDVGGWAYGNVPSAQYANVVIVNCSHTDTRGSVWSSY